MYFDWTGFSEHDFTNYCAKVESAIQACDDYVGNVRVGDLCFDLVACMNEEGTKWFMQYDLYVGGVDTGYGYSNRNPNLPEYAYDYAEGGRFVDSIISMTYSDFKAYAEEVFIRYIVTCSYKEANLIQKAIEPLNIW